MLRAIVSRLPVRGPLLGPIQRATFVPIQSSILSAQLFQRKSASSKASGDLKDFQPKWEFDLKDYSVQAPDSHEIWSNSLYDGPVPYKKHLEDRDLAGDDPNYMPYLKPDLGVGPVKSPLHFPEYDQSIRSTQYSGLPSPPAWDASVLIDPKSVLIGDYPIFEPQYHCLRDPYTYWDKQGRRNYGEILHFHDELTNSSSIGPIPVLKSILQTYALWFSIFGSLMWMLIIWDPESHYIFDKPDFPFDGLRVTMGCDPNDPEDNKNSAPVYVQYRTE